MVCLKHCVNYQILWTDECLLGPLIFSPVPPLDLADALPPARARAPGRRPGPLVCSTAARWGRLTARVSAGRPLQAGWPAPRSFACPSLLLSVREAGPTMLEQRILPLHGDGMFGNISLHHGLCGTARHGGMALCGAGLSEEPPAR
jgi:hypothetical protein